ncbi:hypothetical protein BDN72DRAFT_848948 [Pluteus cervinus]|uniref:Uncharacterized protein n=1 Tax=Pluteus cervinus TaxID=181527 RepID=A0ACD3AA34_9AGAR|nr:hypothetical protein BDN72DRAFT_848948 [Pluteus cervinus]
MDAPLHPPLRIQPNSQTPISAKKVQKRLGTFVDDLQARSTTGAQGVNTAIVVQLQKLKEALKEERELGEGVVSKLDEQAGAEEEED